MRTRSILTRTLVAGAGTLALLACNTIANEPPPGSTSEASASLAAAPVRSGAVELEQLLPEGVFAFASFAGLEASSRAAEDLGLWNLWREPETQALFAPLIRHYDALAAETPAEIEQQWAMAKGLLAGRLSVAVGGLNLLWTEDGPIPVPGVVLSLDAGEHAEQLQGLFHQLLGQVGSAQGGPRVTTREMSGHEVTVVSGTDEVYFDAHVAFVGEQVLVGLGPYLIGHCLENLGGSGRPTLAHSAPFARARSKAAAPPLIEAYLNVDALAARVSGLVPEELLAELHTLGLDDLNAVYYASSVVGGDSQDTVYLDAPTPRRGLLALSDAGGLSLESLAVVPSTAALFAAMSWDMGKTYDLVWSSMENLVPATHMNEVRKELKQAETQLGFGLRDGLLAALGDELVLYAELPRNGIIPNLVASLELRDAAKFRGVLDRLLALAEADVSDLEYQGHQILVLHLDDAPVAPALSIEGSRLLVSLSVPGLKSALTMDPATSIVSSEAFRATFEGMDWRSATSIDYFDAPRVVAFGYNMLENIGPAALGGDAPVDLALLPDRETVLRHFHGLGSVGTADRDGLVKRSRSLSLATVLALAAHVLHESPSVPPFVFERLVDAWESGRFAHAGAPGSVPEKVATVD